MAYDLTAINATNSTLDFFREINNITGPVKLLGDGWTVVLFVIIFMYAFYNTNDARKALLGAGAGTFFVSGLFFLAMGLVDWWIIIVYLVI